MAFPYLGPAQLPVAGSVGNLGSPQFAVTQPIHQVSDINRLYISSGNRYTVGWMNMEGGLPDMPFVVLQNGFFGTGYAIYIVPPVTFSNTSATSGNSLGGGIAGSGALWRTAPYQNTASSTSAVNTGFYAISTNGVDMPQVWVDGGTSMVPIAVPDYSTLVTNGYLAQGNNYGFFPVYVMPLNVTRNDWVSSMPFSNTEATKQLLHGAQSVVTYAGCVVWGGFRMCAPASANPTVYDNFVAFSDVSNPHSLATTSGIISTIRIGDTSEEIVTGMGITSVPTDIMGLKGQLVVFTGRRCVIFDGIPPQSQNPQGVNFSSVVMKGVGCYAPKSICQTPSGLVFLGSDGHWYIIRGINGPEKLGRAVWNIFKAMTPRQMRQVVATWVPYNYLVISYPETSPLLGNTSTSQWVSPYFGGIDVLGLTSPFIAEATTNNRVLYADLNTLGEQGKDMGVRWQGPHTGMQHSCYTVALGVEDRSEIYAGSAVDGSILQVFQTGQVTDPTPMSPLTTTYIDTVAVSGLFDLGDANVDKTVNGFNYAFGTDRATTVYASLLYSASDANIPQSEQDFTDSLTPISNILGSTFTLGTSTTTIGDNVQTVPHRPFPRARGKFFRFIFHENPSAGARCFYSDFSFRFHLNPRRF